jgi:hypothetical protein
MSDLFADHQSGLVDTKLDNLHQFARLRGSLCMTPIQIVLIHDFMTGGLAMAPLYRTVTNKIMLQRLGP